MIFRNNSNKIFMNSHNVTIISNIYVQIRSLKIITINLYHDHIFRYIENILWKIWGVTYRNKYFIYKSLVHIYSFIFPRFNLTLFMCFMQITDCADVFGGGFWLVYVINLNKQIWCCFSSKKNGVVSLLYMLWHTWVCAELLEHLFWFFNNIFMRMKDLEPVYYSFFLKNIFFFKNNNHF